MAVDSRDGESIHIESRVVERRQGILFWDSPTHLAPRKEELSARWGARVQPNIFVDVTSFH